jgi:hypothetical protein
MVVSVRLRQRKADNLHIGVQIPGGAKTKRRGSIGDEALVFRIQLLDASGTILAEWHVNARHIHGAIELLSRAPWPPGAEQVQILDENGYVIRRGGKTSRSIGRTAVIWWLA